MVIRSFRGIRLKTPADGIKISLKEIFFFAGLILWYVQFYTDHSFYEDVFGSPFVRGIRFLSMFVLMFSILLNEIKPRQRVILGTAFLVSFIALDVKAGDLGIQMLQILLLILAAKGVSFCRMCKVMLWTGIVLWLGVVMSDVLGFYHIPASVSNNGDRVREYLNFNYMTFGAIYFNNIVFCALYAYTDPEPMERTELSEAHSEAGWGLIILLAVCVGWIYAMTDTALSFVISLLYICLYVLTIKLRTPLFGNNLFNRVLSVLMYPILAAFTLWISCSYVKGDPFYEALDDFSHSRLELSWTGIQNYGIHVLGRNLHENTDPAKGAYFYVDSGFIKVLLQDGIIVFLLIILLYCIIFYAAVVGRDKVLCIWLFCVAVYSVFNNMMINPVSNGSILSIWYVLELLRRHRHRKRAGVYKRKEGLCVEQ